MLIKDTNHQPGWHRHPNGGGWVANTATVDPESFVSTDSVVEDEATVKGDVRILAGATVSERARIVGSNHPGRYAPVVLWGSQLQVCGKAEIHNSAICFSLLFGQQPASSTIGYETVYRRECDRFTTFFSVEDGENWISESFLTGQLGVGKTPEKSMRELLHSLESLTKAAEKDPSIKVGLIYPPFATTNNTKRTIIGGQCRIEGKSVVPYGCTINGCAVVSNAHLIPGTVLTGHSLISLPTGTTRNNDPWDAHRRSLNLFSMPDVLYYGVPSSATTTSEII